LGAIRLGVTQVDVQEQGGFLRVIIGAIASTDLASARKKRKQKAKMRKQRSVSKEASVSKDT
jgi:hypothetical protein